MDGCDWAPSLALDGKRESSLFARPLTSHRIDRIHSLARIIASGERPIWITGLLGGWSEVRSSGTVCHSAYSRFVCWDVWLRAYRLTTME